MRFPDLARRFSPQPVINFATRLFGSLQAKESLGLIKPPWLPYSLLTAARIAERAGVGSFWAVEFGVASGRGLRQLTAMSEAVSRATGIQVHVAGFDTGSGMPTPTDYRDHPESYIKGDFPMPDQSGLERELSGRAELLLGDIGDTSDEFSRRLTADTPLGFAIIDVDTYSSALKCFQVFRSEPACYLPRVPVFFDDVFGSEHYTRFAGEALAIDEFNTQESMRKLDLDRSVWNKHKALGPQLWHNKMYLLHVFDHPWRTAKKRAPKIIK